MYYNIRYELCYTLYNFFTSSYLIFLIISLSSHPKNVIKFYSIIFSYNYFSLDY